MTTGAFQILIAVILQNIYRILVNMSNEVSIASIGIICCALLSVGLCLWGNLVISIKRSRDCNQSVWFPLYIWCPLLIVSLVKIPLIILIASSVALIAQIYLGFWKGSHGKNRFGQDWL